MEKKENGDGKSMETAVTRDPNPVRFCCPRFAVPVYAVKCHTIAEPYRTMEITRVTLPLQLAMCERLLS